MSNQGHQNAVEGMLLRLNISEAIPKFKEMNVDRIVSLRRLNEEQLRQAVPDDAKRERLLEAINSRGSLQNRRGGAGLGQPHPPRSADADFVRGGGYHDNRGIFSRGRGRGASGVGSGRARGGGGLMGDESMRPCRHFFSPEGCKYGDSCRYSHDESLRYQIDENDAMASRPDSNRIIHHEFSEVVEIPTDRIKYLLGFNGTNLKAIHDKCGTYNERFDAVDEAQDIFPLKLYGSSREFLQIAREMVLNAVGVKREEERKNRSQYAMNEFEVSTRAAKLLAACNTKIKDTPRHLSDRVLRSVISSIRFVRPQQVRHFFVNSSTSDREKLETVSKIITQLQGVQAIVFCEQKRVESFSNEGGIQRLVKHFNGVRPKFLFRNLKKEERMQNLEEFKKGTPNENGVKQRLLITNEDYAKLARKTVIPYVNLVINLTVPRNEFYVMQSLVAGRQDTLGVSFLFVSPPDEAKFRDLEKLVHFEQYENEESFRETALQMMYDTRDHSLTPADAEPRDDWREHLNDPKPKVSNRPKHH